MLCQTGLSRHLFVCNFWHPGTLTQPWASEYPDVKNYKWHLNPVWHSMLYSYTHMATVGVKGLTMLFRLRSCTLRCAVISVVVCCNCSVVDGEFETDNPSLQSKQHLPNDVPQKTVRQPDTAFSCYHQVALHAECWHFVCRTDLAFCMFLLNRAKCLSAWGEVRHFNFAVLNFTMVGACVEDLSSQIVNTDKFLAWSYEIFSWCAYW